MNLDDVILLGVKSRVMAISKHDGKIIWSTELPGSMGDGFIRHPLSRHSRMNEPIRRSSQSGIAVSDTVFKTAQAVLTLCDAKHPAEYVVDVSEAGVAQPSRLRVRVAPRQVQTLFRRTGTVLELAAETAA